MRPGSSVISRLWLHRYIVTMTLAIALIIGFSAFTMIPSLWNEAESWRVILDTPSKTEIAAIESEINTLTAQNVEMRRRLAIETEHQRSKTSSQQTLALIRGLADSLGLKLESISCNRSRGLRQNERRTLMVRAEGRYHHFGYFTSMLEASECELIIKELTLMRKVPVSSTLSGVITLTSGGKEQEPW